MRAIGNAVAELTEISAFPSKLPSNLDVKGGISDIPELGDKLKVTILASGFDLTLIEGESSEGDGKQEKEKVVIFGDPHKEAEENVARQNEIDRKIAEIYGKEKLTAQLSAANRAKYAVLHPSQYDNYEAIALLERYPAFMRDPQLLDEIMEKADGKPQRTTAQPKTDTPTPTGNEPASDFPKNDNTNNNVISF